MGDFVKGLGKIAPLIFLLLKDVVVKIMEMLICKNKNNVENKSFMKQKIKPIITWMEIFPLLDWLKPRLGNKKI